jgi:sterol desaturase/sphingolipid hydroxylase (fatty acid hydroxylase superfamily)
MLFFLLTIATLLVITVVEMLTRRVDWSSRAINLQAWGVSLAGTTLFLPAVQYSMPVSLVSGASAWIVIPLYVVVNDFAEYLFHRAQHAFPILWRMHSLHHSDHDMNATTTQRHFWGDPFLKSLTVWPLAALIVAPTPAASAVYALAMLWNFVSHAGIEWNFGSWSWLLNSPAYHRRHHSVLPEHFNSNFAALFPLFDVIAGSYHRPEGFPPTGLDHRPQSIFEVMLWPLRGIVFDKELPVAGQE